MRRSFIAILLILAMLFTLAGCTKKNENEVSNTDIDEPAGEENNGKDNAPDDTAEPDPDGDGDNGEGDVPEEDHSDLLKAGFLNGSGGIGAAYFMQQNDEGKTETGYDIAVKADVSDIKSAIISGELDIAAVPANVAVTLYNETDGDIRLVAINTLGTLYILENGSTVNSAADLGGRTVYAAGQGTDAQYILEYILTQYGFTVGEDVFVEYMETDELAGKMASGKVNICMLPAPAAASVLVQNPDVRTAISLTEEWESVTGGRSVLAQGCIVARTDTVSDEALESFLRDCEKSVNYMAEEANIDAAAALAVQYGMTDTEDAAKKALSDLNLVFISDPDTMREYLANFYQILYASDPASIGGSVPDDAFYR